MFYYVGKIAWALINPVTLYVILAFTTALACFLRGKRLAHILAGMTVAVTMLAIFVPLGAYLNIMIENRFPQPKELPETVDGIIVLGGPVDPEMTHDRGVFAVGGSFDRIIAFAELATRYENARLVYSGGSHSWTPGIGEADVVAPLLAQMGVDTNRMIFEPKSRNTYQNARYSYGLASPGDDETWILITSGYHMPRAMGTFRHTGWPRDLIAYPVDFRFTTDAAPRWFSLNVLARLDQLGGAMHELLGLSAYYLTNRTDEWFPSPSK